MHLDSSRRANIMFHQFVYILFVAILLAKARKHEEPMCSKYDFENKVLEKLVRLEHKMELNEKKLENWDKDMKDQFSKINNGEVSRTDKMERKISEINDAEVTHTNHINELRKTIQQSLDEQKEQLEKLLTSFNQQVNRLSQDLKNKQGQINQTMLASIERQEMVINKLKDDLVTPTVVFKAKDVADETLSTGSRIRYIETVINEGGGYNTETGFFITPHPGTYLFTVQACVHPKKNGMLQLVAADKVIGTMYNYNFMATTCTSGTGVAVLSVGDKVWVKCATSGKLYNYTEYWNSFSGILIHTNTN